MHHFLTIPSRTLCGVDRPGIEHIMRVEMPHLAYEHDFMMHCILGMSALHLHHLAPEAKENHSLTIVHRVNALSGLRAAVTTLSRDNYRGILAASLFLLVLASDRSMIDDERELWCTGWFALWAGLREMIRLVSWDYLQQSSLAPMFARDDGPRGSLKSLPLPLSTMLASMDPDNENTKIITSTLEYLGKLYNALSSGDSGSVFDTKVISWPGSTDICDLTRLMRQVHPEALVITAYYLAFTKLMSGVWWMDGIADQEIETIARLLPGAYLAYMAVPLKAIGTNDRSEIAVMLLSEAPHYEALFLAERPNCDVLKGIP